MSDDRRFTLFLLRLLIYILLGVLTWSVLSQLSLVLSPVCVALVLAFLLDPSVRSLEARGLPRWLAVVLMVLGFIGVLTGVGLLMPMLITRELERFASELPAYEQLVNTKLLPLLGKVFKVRAVNLNDYLRLLVTQVSDWARGAAGQLSSALGSALLGVAGFVRILLAVLLVPIFAVAFLMDMPNLMANVRTFVPPRHQPTASAIVHDIYIALGGWLRGQLTVMLIQAALYSIGLSLCGVPLAVVIGCVAGFLAFVPYVGVSIGLLLAVIAALLEVSSRGAAPLIGVVATFGTVQLLDALVITPRAVGGRIGLSAVGVIFALGLGGSLLGYAGLLLAVPVAAVLKALWPRLLDAYTSTNFYRGEAASAEPAPVVESVVEPGLGALDDSGGLGDPPLPPLPPQPETNP